MARREISEEKSTPSTENTSQTGSKAQGEIRINGMAQVFDMLKAADPEFRESLLRRLSVRDPQLADRLRVDLARAGIY